ncbi:MAG TPA: lysophospholipid acyltransferase family protein [Bacteroidales bacterium]|nr:lysophospholipid acyltransferase family protein [Bacteroidales bacterium]
MIKAKHHTVIYPMFKMLTRFLMRRRFASARINGDFSDSGHAVLVISNHISWWDGFWMMHLNLKRLNRKFHFMMLENQLQKHWYFQYSGAYSVRKNSRSLLESLDYTTDLLEEKQTMAFMFPQGKIHSMHQHSIHFEKGIERILRNCPSETQVIFSVNMVDYFSDAKPHLSMSIQQHKAGDFQTTSVERAYQTFYNQVMNQQKTITS